MSSTDSNIHQVVYIAVSHYSKVAQLRHKLIYLWQAWRRQHFFHTFEKSLGGRKRTWRNCCITHYVCVCLLDCMYETCVRLLAVLWGMVLLGSSFRKPNTGMGRGPLELWTSSTMTKGRLTSEAVWGDNKSGSRQRGLSWEGSSSRIIYGPSLESVPIMVLLCGAKTWTAVSTFLCFSFFMHISLKTGSLFTRILTSPFFKLLLSIQRQALAGMIMTDFEHPLLSVTGLFHVKDHKQTDILLIADMLMQVDPGCSSLRIILINLIATWTDIQ